MEKNHSENEKLNKGVNSSSLKYFLPIIFAVIVLIIAGVTIFTSYNNKQITNAPLLPPPLSNLTSVPEPPFLQGPVPGQVLVKFKKGTSDIVIEEHLKPLNIKVQGKIEGVNVTILEVPNGQEEYIRGILSKDPIVQYAERNYYAHTTLNPNDTDFVKEWGLFNSGGSVVDPKTNQSKQGTANADIHAAKAWDVTRGTGIKVGIVDTGIDMTHPDLTGKIAETVVYITSTVDDGFGHGTHVAGILAANTNNTEGIAGTCPDCQLYIAKSLNDAGAGDMAAIAKGITWAADKGVKVINISAGGPTNTQALSDAVKYAQGKGALIVAGAGNFGNTSKFYPAADTGVMGVAATDNTDTMADFSTRGSWVQIAAPGFGIYSTIHHSRDSGLKSGYPNLTRTYGSISGTSMASPFVSGVAALVFSTQYGTSADAVRQRLCDTADKIAGTGTNWVCGRVNAEAAVGAGTVTNPSTQPSTIQNSPVPSQTGPTTPPTGTVVPTFVCAGSSVGDQCPPTNSPTNPGSGGTTSPTNTQQTSPSPSISSEQNNNQNNNNKKSGKNKKSGNNSGNNKTSKGLLNMIMDFIKMLLDMIMKLLGGKS